MEKFTTTIPGYKKSEVHKFVNDCINQVEGMINKMKAKDLEIEKLKAELEHYKNLESTFNRAIMVAEVAKIKANISSIEVQVKNAEKEIETLQEEIVKMNKRKG